MYRRGRGLRANVIKAVQFMRLAAERGHAEAQYSYAEMFAEGQGLDRDDVQAYKWLTLAAKRASDTRTRDAANRSRKQVAARLSAEQRQDAERRAKKWRPQDNRLLVMPSE
jgi:TPR repeat protein